jgi:hypothetical protein
MGAVTIGVATYDSMKTKTAFCLAAAVTTTAKAGVDVHFAARSGPYTHWNREALVEDAVNAGTDHLMMIDTDMVFPADAILTLLSRGKDVIGGAYMMKQLPPIHTVKMAAAGGGFTEEQDVTLPAGPFQCAAVGTGFMLINMEAISVLERPLFECVSPIGEDVAFCLKAAAADLEVWCDPTLGLKHIGDHEF